MPFELVQIFGEGIERSVPGIVKEADQFPAQILGAEIVLSPHATLDLGVDEGFEPRGLPLARAVTAHRAHGCR